MISKTKERRLLLLNDLLVCVTVSSKSGDDYRSLSERLSLKWAFTITDIEVSHWQYHTQLQEMDAITIFVCFVFSNKIEDTSTSPTLSRLLSSGSNLRALEAISGVDNLCQEMNHLMHDYDVITRIDSLIKSLQGQYSVSSSNEMFIMCIQGPHLKCDRHFSSSWKTNNWKCFCAAVEFRKEYNAGSSVEHSTKTAAESRGNVVDRFLLSSAHRSQPLGQGRKVYFSDGFTGCSQRLGDR